MLKVNDVSMKFGTQTVLKNLSFTLDRGEIVGFLGPNGAGKSTALKIIAGSIAADSGSVVISGHDLALDPLAAKAQVGYLPEDNPLYEDMYVEEYLNYVAGLYSLENCSQRIARVMIRMSLRSESDKKIRQLSKGYRQRVGMAQAILHDPDVLLLDEPTSGLDPRQREMIHNLLLDLKPTKAILLSTHSLGEVAALCTRILFLHRGAVAVDVPRGQIADLEVLFREFS
jgi:ABC-2 type transport system ATP-binding protein